MAAKKELQAQIEQIFHRFEAHESEPQTELEFTNPFTLLVAIVLSAQATDVGVNKATRALFAKYDTPEKMLSLGEEGLRSYIKTIGLFNSKAKNVILLCQQLLERHAGEIPHGQKELEALAGVGQKTASVWRNAILGDLTIAVDTHVFRVSHRLGISDAPNPDKTQAQLEARIPKQYLRHAHHWLILHGRYTCVARAPKCSNCLVADLCPRLGVEAIKAGAKNIALKKKPAAKSRAKKPAKRLKDL
jgi:endonuclease-3